MLINALLEPNIAYIILVLALVLTMLALFAPGTGFLEAAALAALIASGFSIANIPVNSWALLAILVGIILVIISIRREVRWYFLAISIVLLIGGTAFTYQNGQSVFSADPFLVLIASVSLGAFIWIVGHNAGQAFRQPARVDMNEVIGEVGRAVSDVSQSGSVYAGGQEWSATSDSPIRAGKPVKVIGRKGFVLIVEEVKDSQKKK
jgi:membrane-bound serine protease (ClpP class)